jgi:hypothetical protein
MSIKDIDVHKISKNAFGKYYVPLKSMLTALFASSFSISNSKMSTLQISHVLGILHVISM